MTDEQKQAMQEHGSKDGGSKQRTFTQAEVTEIVKRRLSQQERKHQQEIEELRATLGVNVERAQHLEHDNAKAREQLEELEELRAYKTQRQRDDLLSRISAEFGGIPVELLDGETEEELYAKAGKIRAFADKFKPKVPSVNAAGATPAPDGIDSILNEQDRTERIRKIAENLELFG